MNPRSSTNKTKPTLYWKLVRTGFRNRSCRWKRHRLNRVKGPAVLCSQGIHACPAPSYTFSYILGGTFLCQVEFTEKARLDKSEDKVCGPEMRIRKVYLLEFRRNKRRAAERFFTKISQLSDHVISIRSNSNLIQDILYRLDVSGQEEFIKNHLRDVSHWSTRQLQRYQP